MKKTTFALVSVLTITALFAFDYDKSSILNPSEFKLIIQSNTSSIPKDSLHNYIVKCMIQNNSKSDVTLVQPGDGSLSGWRTPIVKWSVIKENDQLHNFQQNNLSRCGNMNDLDEKEIFGLKSGHQQILSKNYYYPIIPNEAGTYKIKYSYSNLPKLKWKNQNAHGMSLNYFNRKIMRKIKKTDKLELLSNELEVQVTN